MSQATRQIFKRIVLRNHILSETEAEALLAEVQDPEEAIRELAVRGMLSEKKAEQFLAVYLKQVDKQFAEELGFDDEPLPAASPDPSPGSLPEQAAEEADTGPTAATPEPDEEPEPVPVREDAAPERQEQKPLPGTGRDMVHVLLQEARDMNASDVHLKANMPPIVRIHGALRELPYPRITADVCEQSVLELLDDAQREQFLKTKDLDFCYDGGSEMGRFRTNFFSEHWGVDAVFRAIPRKVPSLKELGLPKQVKRFTENRVGVVLVTGPKGSGKTTTLAAMVDLINTNRAEHIITVEDPIEFVHPCKEGHVNQRQVGVHTQSFSNALRAALREAPDVIMVGEMRDLETTSLAITAAETGHLVLATLHTPDAIRTIGRVLDVFPPKEQPQIRAMLSESLRGICSQLLLPNADGTGMVLAVEILVNTQAIGHLIREEKVHQIRGLMQTGKQHGMILMDESLINLAKSGKITRDDAFSWADNIKMVREALG